MTSFNGNWLEFLVFAFMIAIGLALLRQSPATRGTALALLVILLLLLGVFLPTFAMQVLNGGLLMATVLTVLMWSAWFLYERSQRPRPAPVAVHVVTPSQSNPAVPESVAPPPNTAPRVSPPAAGETSTGGDIHG